MLHWLLLGYTCSVGKCKSVRSLRPQLEEAPHILLQTNQDTGTPEIEGEHHNTQSFVTKVGAQPGATYFSFHDNKGKHVASYG